MIEPMACLKSAKRHAYSCAALQVPVGGEEVAAEVAVVGSPHEFDFEIRSVVVTSYPLHSSCTLYLCIRRPAISCIYWLHKPRPCNLLLTAQYSILVKQRIYRLLCTG